MSLLLNRLNVYTELILYLNSVDFLLKTRCIQDICNFKSVRIFLFFEQIVDFNVLVYCRIFAFCFFIFMLNIFSKSLRIYKHSSHYTIGLVSEIVDINLIFELFWDLYLFYFRYKKSVRRCEIILNNCFVLNIYNIFLFPSFFQYYDDFEELKFCSLKIVILFSNSGVILRLFLSSLNIGLLL